MIVSIEGFLLDNLLMNYLMLRLCSALSGYPLRRAAGLGASALGAGYALLSVTRLPALAFPVPKLLLGCLLVLPLVHDRRDYVRALLLLYVSACLMGGLVLCVCILLGGSLRSGVLVGTIPLRIALLGAVLSAGLPRLFRMLKNMFDGRETHVQISIVLSDRTLALTALVDSGNMLTEPISGKPIVIVQHGLLKRPLENCRPVAYRTIDGAGYLQTIEPKRIRVFYRRWHTVDAFVAESPTPIAGAEAILAASLIPAERRGQNAETSGEMAETPISAAALEAQQGTVLHTFGRNAAAAVCGGGRTGVDQTLDDGGTGSQERAD